MISIGGSDGQIANQRRTEDSNNLAVKYTNTVFTYGSTDGTSNLQSTKLLIKCYLFFTCYSIKRTDCKDTQDSLFIIRNSAVQRYPKKVITSTTNSSLKCRDTKMSSDYIVICPPLITVNVTAFLMSRTWKYINQSRCSVVNR